MSSSNSNIMYIYNLPYHERKELCKILDQNDKWEELGGTYMGFDVMTLQNIRREVYIANGAHQWRSPTEELLTLWGHRNHTVLELFILLSQMHHYQSMMTLKPFVDAKYHSLIYEGEQNLSNLIQKLQVRNKNEPCVKDLKIGEENFNDSSKILNAIAPVNSRRSSTGARPISNNAASNARAAVVSKEGNESIAQDNNRLKPAEEQPVRRTSFENELPSDVARSFQISYDELAEATNNWDPSTILGKGGFGTVFKGTWKHTLVAIKRIEQRLESPEDNSVQVKQSITELQCLNTYRHDNVLPLYGYSLSGAAPCLVYQYLGGGCLERRLRSAARGPLSWAKRLHVATGVARGLQFLHTIGEKPLIHGDIKPANILLDLNDEPKIGDFGLNREGTWKHTLVAIKRIEQRLESPEDNSVQVKQSITELQCLNTYRHDNVLPLYGYSLSGAAPCLVYQYLGGGCLERRLRSAARGPLSWAKRLHVATGVARGLQFLHTIGEKPLIHGDIKPANILLDLNDEPKIGDFGLAREGPQSDYTHIKVSRIHGTRPYLPDEFLRAKKMSTKVDTYSFGIVLFEISTGLTAYSDSRPNKFLKDHIVNYEGDIAELIDRRAGDENNRYFLHFIHIGKFCVSKRAKDRPEMRDVFISLEGVKNQYGANS